MTKFTRDRIMVALREWDPEPIDDGAGGNFGVRVTVEGRSHELWHYEVVEEFLDEMARRAGGAS